MQPEHIGHFTKVLESERARVEAELAELGVKNPDSAKNWDASVGDIDTSATEQDELADRQEELEERRDELDALKARYKDIQDALKKIEDGTYGVCEISGEDIERDRLEANPAARTCKAHMGEME